MEFESFNVEFRRSRTDGHSLGPFLRGTIEFDMHADSGLPILLMNDKKNNRTEKFLMQEIESLPPGCNTTLATRVQFKNCSLYLKFRAKDELERFLKKIRSTMHSGNTFVSNDKAARRSPRLKKNEQKMDRPPEMRENGVSNGLEPSREIIVEPSENEQKDTKLNWLWDMAADSDPSPIPKLQKTPDMNYSNRVTTRTNGFTAETKPPPQIRMDKENQHKTPVKAPIQMDLAEKRTPLIPKHVSTPATAAFASTSADTWLFNLKTPDRKIPGIANMRSYQDGGQSITQKRPAAGLVLDDDLKPKKLRTLEFDEGFASSRWRSSNESEKTKQQLKGFSNIGNTCYMNAILQALFALSPFAKELHKNFRFFDEKIQNDTLFFNLPMLLTVKDSDNEELRVDFLRNIKNSISASATRFLGYEQHDAHEFLAQVLDQLKEEISKLVADRVVVRTPPPNPVQSNFEFAVCHAIECRNCHNVLCQEEIAHSLSLILPTGATGKSRRPLYLQPLLDDYFNDEPVSHKCEKCGSDGALVSHKFKKLPRILVLHLKRYTFSNEVSWKVVTGVAFPRFLSLHRLCADNIEKSSLLTESTKKIVTGTPTEIAAIEMAKSSARRQLPFDADDTADSAEPDRKFSFRREGTRLYDGTRAYYTRASAQGGRVTYDGIDDPVDSDLAEALEKSKYDKGPPAEFLEDDEFEKQMQQAIQLSMIETSGGSDAVDLNVADIEEEIEEFSENDIEDEEMRRNAEDGHLQPAFQLCGVVNHLGAGTGSGHYVSDVLDMQSYVWRSYDDSHVTDTSEEYVRKNRQKSGYIFFYISKAVLEDMKNRISSP